MPAKSSGRFDQPAKAGDLSLPVQNRKKKKFKRTPRQSGLFGSNPLQEQQEQLVTQRSAQSQRFMARIADRALLDAYVKVGLDDAGVRKFLRGADVKGK